jgi:hypothetical protein
MANEITKPIILDETGKDIAQAIRELSGGGGGSVIITLTKGESVRQVDNKTFLAMCESGLFTSDDLGTMASIPNLINGQTMRIRLIGLNHDVLSNTDLGELEPNGVKAKTTWQFYDMPFQKVNLGLPYEEEKTGHVRSSQPSDVSIDDCAEVTVTTDAPSNMHGYTSAVGLLNAMQEIFNSLPNWLKNAIKTVRKDCFISELSANGYNYENFDSTGTLIAMESDRYGSCINAKLFCLSATEIGIIPNPQETFNAFPYKIQDGNGDDVMLEGTKYEYFNETYPYTSEPENDKRRPCKYNDQDWDYWLRSPYLLEGGSWGSCNGSGYVGNDGTDGNGGVAPAFCI